jgi:hypothetical protein
MISEGGGRVIETRESVDGSSCGRQYESVESPSNVQSVRTVPDCSSAPCLTTCTSRGPIGPSHISRATGLPKELT